MRGRSLLVALALLGCRGQASAPGEPRPPPGAVDAGAPDGGAAPGNLGSPLGQNLHFATYYTGTWPFVDAMKLGEAFFSGTASEVRDGRPLEVDDDGWPVRLLPGQVARSPLVFPASPDGAFPAPHGLYTVLFEGDGELAFGDARVVERGPGRAVVELPPGGHLWVEVAGTNEAAPLRRIRVLMPGGRCELDPFRACDGADGCPAGACVPFERDHAERPFHPTFLADHRAFKVLRFMDWFATNRPVPSRAGSTATPPEPERWARTSRATWGQVPLEVALELARTLAADPWINVPYGASDDLVRAMAEAVAAGLAPGLRAYVESSNEVWNLATGQHHHAAADGCRQFAADPEGECRAPGRRALCGVDLPGPQATACARYSSLRHAQRTAEVMAIFEEVVGVDRLVRVLGAQVGAMPWRTLGELDHRWRGDEPVAARVDAVAVAPYFGHDAPSGPADAVFARLDRPRRGWPAGTFALLVGGADEGATGVLDWVRTDLEALRARPDLARVGYLAYEGGPHLVSYADRATQDAYLALNRDPRMGEALLQLLDTWRELTGGALFVHFQGPGAGIWGSKFYQGQPREEAPKHDALLRHVEAVQAGAR